MRNGLKLPKIDEKTYLVNEQECSTYKFAKILPTLYIFAVMRKRRWTDKELVEAAKGARSYRKILERIGLRATGGNYAQIKKWLDALKIIPPLQGYGWSRGLKGVGTPRIPLEKILVASSDFQSFKLKKRLFLAGIKQQRCEECGWAARSPDGRIPLELDHINGNRRDNRLENLRILCPNCHSLKPTHRGANIKRNANKK